MYIESLTKNIDATLAIAEEKLLRPAFHDDDFKRVKKQTLEGIGGKQKECTIFRVYLFWQSIVW